MIKDLGAKPSKTFVILHRYEHAIGPYNFILKFSVVGNICQKTLGGGNFFSTHTVFPVEYRGNKKLVISVKTKQVKNTRNCRELQRFLPNTNAVGAGYARACRQ